jgi:hypothetical protein
MASAAFFNTLAVKLSAAAKQKPIKFSGGDFLASTGKSPPLKSFHPGCF